MLRGFWKGHLPSRVLALKEDMSLGWEVAGPPHPLAHRTGDMEAAKVPMWVGGTRGKKRRGFQGDTVSREGRCLDPNHQGGDGESPKMHPDASVGLSLAATMQPPAHSHPRAGRHRPLFWAAQSCVLSPVLFVLMPESPFPYELRMGTM